MFDLRDIRAVLPQRQMGKQALYLNIGQVEDGFDLIRARRVVPQPVQAGIQLDVEPGFPACFPA